MSSAVLSGSKSPASTRLLSRPALGVIISLFCGYIAVGLPLAVLPLFIHDHLGFSNLVVGLTIGILFLVTVLTRGYAGQVSDRDGGKRAALQGAAGCVAAGLMYLCATIHGLSPAVALTFVIAGRIASGFGESLFITGCVSWSIASVGPQRAGMSMSWTGIAMFSALSIGAPIGMALHKPFGPQAVMLACIAAPATAFVIAFGTTSYVSPAGKRLPFRKVVGQIVAPGLSLTLHGVGLASLTAFSALYFSSRSWAHAGIVMTCFGVGFIAVRMMFGHLPDWIGGYKVALWSFVVEAIGQALLWSAPNEALALVGALVTGLGCALIYPSLGVEAIKRVPPANRGSAIGAFAAFLDIAHGVTGPLAGLVASRLGYAEVYALGAFSAALGALLVLWSRRAQAR